MTFLLKSRGVTHKMATATCIFMTILLCGCSYHGQLKEEALSDNQVISNKIAAKVTLLNRMEGIKNLDFTSGFGTFNYDVKEPYFNALKDTLNIIYDQVETGPEASPTSQLIAVPYFDATFSGAGIDTISRIDILDGISKKLIKSYQAKQHSYYVSPPSAQAPWAPNWFYIVRTDAYNITNCYGYKGRLWARFTRKSNPRITFKHKN
jgi:hypothetical protein